MKTKEALLQIFNQYNVKPSELTACIETQFNILNKDGKLSGDIVWYTKSDPRFIKPLGVTASKALSNFLFSYKRRWRMNLVAQNFYSLTDDEIADMFIELPYFLKAYGADDQFMPSAEKFLKEKLWMENYPNKPKGERKRKQDITVEGWDEFLATVPENIRGTYEMFRESMTFVEFKATING